MAEQLCAGDISCLPWNCESYVHMQEEQAQRTARYARLHRQVHRGEQLFITMSQCILESKCICRRGCEYIFAKSRQALMACAPALLQNFNAVEQMIQKWYEADAKVYAATPTPDGASNR